MTRLMVMTFWGSERFRERHIEEPHAGAPHHNHYPHEPRESPLSMTVPLIVLAILSTVGGLVGVPYALSSLAGGHPENYFERTLEPVITRNAAEGAGERIPKVHWQSPPPQEVDGKPAFGPSDTSTGEAVSSSAKITEERSFTLISIAIALGGIGLGFFLFLRRPLLSMPRLLENKYYVDEIYDAAIINPIHATSREGFWKIFDLGVIDGILHTLGAAVVKFGRAIRYMQIGFVRGYAAIILAGAIIIIGYFAYSGVHVLRFLVR